MTEKRRRKWKWGDKSEVAKRAGISPHFLCDIMTGRKACPVKHAAKLEAACAELGYRMTASEWVFINRRTRNPLFPATSRKAKHN